MKSKIVLTKEGGTWSAHDPSVPGVYGLGPTRAAAKADLREALALLADYVASQADDEAEDVEDIRLTDKSRAEIRAGGITIPLEDVLKRYGLTPAAEADLRETPALLADHDADQADDENEDAADVRAADASWAEVLVDSLFKRHFAFAASHLQPESSDCGGGRAAVRRGASLGMPRLSRILRIASGPVIAARIFMRPWHFGHVSASVMNTRFRRTAQGSRLPLCILVISISRDSPVPALSSPAASAPAVSGMGCAGGAGTTLSRSLAAGPRMPWYRTRWQRGRGINGMSFSISSCARTRPGPRGRNTLLQVAWKAPAGVLGDGLEIVARVSGERLGRCRMESAMKRLAPCILKLTPPRDANYCGRVAVLDVL